MKNFMSEDNLIWQVTNRYSNRQEAEESIREHWRGYFAEKASVATLLTSIFGVVAFAGVSAFVPEYKDLQTILGVGTVGLFNLGFWGFCLQGLAINHETDSPNNHRPSDFYHVARRYLRTGRNTY